MFLIVNVVNVVNKNTYIIGNVLFKKFEIVNEFLANKRFNTFTFRLLNLFLAYLQHLQFINMLNKVIVNIVN
jgi:hypothetical protein